MTDWRYRFSDEFEITHVEDNKMSQTGSYTGCGRLVRFGEEWSTNVKEPITCLQCLGVR